MLLKGMIIRAKKIDREKGFTLIELMIVVAILGILAAIAIPNFMRFQAKSRQSEAKTNLGGIGTTAEAYRAEFDTYIATWNNLGWAPQGTARYGYGYNALEYSGTGAVTAYAPETLGVAAAASTFVVAAEGDIDSETTGHDCWTYNQARTLANPTNDVSQDAACY